jgi:hypothetical protein
MPNYDEMVDYVTRKFEDRGQTPDPAAVMRVSARIIKKQGVQVDATHMAGLSDAARRRLAAPTQNGTAPGSWERVKEVAGEYGSGVADALNVAGKTISLGSTAAVGGVALPFVSNETGARWSDTVRQQASDLGVAQERAGGLNSAAGAMMAGPLAPAAILGGVAQKGAQMQDQGQNPTDLANRINLGGTAALQTGLTAAGAGVGAGAARLGTVAGGTAFGLRGVAGQAALAGTGAAAGLAATGAQAGLDYATGNEQFAPGAEDYLVNAGMNAAVPAMAMARTGVAGALRAAEGRRQVNMDQLLAAKQGDAALADAAANDAAVSKRIDLEDAQQQAVAKAQEALSNTPEVASERARIDADIRQAQYEGVAGAVDNTSVADRILRERMAADREAFNAADQEQYAREQAQQDAEMAQRDAEAQTLSEVLPPSEAVNESVSSYSSPYLQKSPLDGPLSNKSAKEIEGMFVADAAIGDKHLQRLFKEDWEKAKKQLNRTGEINDNLLNKHNVDLGTNSPDYAAIYQYGYDARDYRKELSNLQEAENLQSPEDMGYFLINNLSDTLSKSGDTLSGKLSNQAMVLVSDKIRAAGLDPVEVMRKAGADQISSGLRTVKEVNQIAEVIQSQMEQRIKKSVGKNTQPSEASLFIDTAADTAPVQEGTPVQAPEPRYLVEPATGKARLVTDRMTVDPKETVAYSDLTPEQKNRVDVAAKNLSRRVVGRDVTRSGAAINPAIPLVEGMQALGKGAKVVRDKADALAETIQGGVGDATPLARSIRGAQEWLGADMQDRLKKSSNPYARNAGERIGRSIENQHASQGRMHVDRTKALELVSASADKAAALRKADEPIKPMDPEQEYTSGRLRNMYEGRTDVPEILRDVVDGVQLTNQSTRKEATDQGLDVVKGDGNNVFVRHKTQEFYNLLDEGAGSWFGQRLIRSLVDMNNMDPKKVQELLYPDTKEGRGISASVRMDAIEQSRKFKNFPQYIRNEKGDGWIRLLETDPTRYVNTTFDAMSRRVGFHKGFGGVSSSADLGNILPGLELAPKSVRETVARAINAFNGEHETSLDMSSGNAIAGLRNAKQIISAMQTSGAAPMDLTETLNIAAHVPVTHAFTGVVNSVRKPGRAVQEGGMEADVKNRVDLRGKGTEVSGNVAGALRRGFGRNVVNRAVQAAGYEAGRSWASSLQKNGVALVDEGFLTMNRVSDQMAQRFRDKKATDQDVKVLATMVAENITGQKRNVAQSGRLSRNALVAMVGPLYRRYGENRVRNLIRAVDGAAAIMAKKDQPLAKRAAIASRMLGQSLTATGFSSAAATAVGGALVYGLEALPMYFGSSQGTIPLLVNVLGGGVAGSVLQQTQQPGNLAVTDLASMLFWPFGYASSVANAVSSGKPQNLVPGVSRIMGAVSNDDRAGKLAYRAFRSAQAKVESSTGSGFTANAYRRALRDAVLSGNRDDIREALAAARKAQSPDDFQTFLKRSILLPSDPVKLRKYYNEIGEEAFRKIQAHDATIKKFIDGA